MNDIAESYWSEDVAFLRNHKHTTVEFMRRVLRIRDSESWRAEYKSWDSFCKAELDFGGRRGDQLCDAAIIIAELPEQIPQTFGTVVPVPPLNERVVRQLATVPAADRPALLDKATQASRGKVTAKAIKEAKGPMPRPASAGTPFTTRGRGKDAPAADFSADIAEMDADLARDNRKKKSGLSEKDQRKAESLFGQLQTVLHRAGLAERLGDHLEAIIRAIKGKA